MPVARPRDRPSLVAVADERRFGARPRVKQNSPGNAIGRTNVTRSLERSQAPARSVVCMDAALIWRRPLFCHRDICTDESKYLDCISRSVVSILSMLRRSVRDRKHPGRESEQTLPRIVPSYSSRLSWADQSQASYCHDASLIPDRSYRHVCARRCAGKLSSLVALHEANATRGDALVLVFSAHG